MGIDGVDAWPAGVAEQAWDGSVADETLTFVVRNLASFSVGSKLLAQPRLDQSIGRLSSLHDGHPMVHPCEKNMHAPASQASCFEALRPAFLENGMFIAPCPTMLGRASSNPAVRCGMGTESGRAPCVRSEKKMCVGSADTATNRITESGVAWEGGSSNGGVGTVCVARTTEMDEAAGSAG